jgi:hypothetical protein
VPPKISRAPATRPMADGADTTLHAPERVIEAAVRGDSELLRLAIGPSLPAQKLDEALCWAAFAGHLTVVQLLTHQGANVNACDAVGRTPAHWASHMGHLSVLQWLQTQGADLLAAEQHASAVVAQGGGGSAPGGHTPLELAVWKGHLSVVEWLCEGSRGGVAELRDAMMRLLHTKPHLCRAAAAGRLEMVMWLVERGLMVDGIDEHAKSPLWHAAEGRHAGVASWLLDHGASASRLPPSALSELLCAASSCGDTKLLASALAAGAPLAPAGACGATPIECALISRAPGCVLLLAAARADVLGALVGGGSLGRHDGYPELNPLEDRQTPSVMGKSASATTANSVTLVGEQVVSSTRKRTLCAPSISTTFVRRGCTEVSCTLLSQ